MVLPWTVYPEAKSPHQIIEEASGQVLEVLKRDEEAIRQDPSKINDLVDEIILPICDLERMGKYILAKHWKAASQEQRNAFITEFKKMLIRTYGKHMAEYSSASIEIVPEKKTEKKLYQSVGTKLDLKNGTQPLLIDYIFRADENSTKLVDVRVEGMSILRTFRTAFTYEIAETSLDALIQRIANTNRHTLVMNTH